MSLGFVHAAALGELARVAQAGRTGRQEVGIQRNHHVRVAEIVIRVDRLSECLHGRGARAVRPRGLPLMPLGGRIQFLDGAQLLRHARRSDRLGENADARAVLALLLRQRIAQGARVLAPGTDLAVEAERLRSVGIVKLQNRGLRIGIACAQRGGVFGVALHLGGPALVAFHQHSVGDAVQRRRGSEEQRAPRNQVFRLAHVRHDVFGGLARAGSHAGQCQRRAHQLQKIAPALHRVFILAPADCLAGELALQQILELRRCRQVVQAAPVIAPASAFQPGP